MTVAGTRTVMIDGEIALPDEAKVSVYDRGFLFGDAVFEVLRTYDGVPFALAEHVARLRRSAERVFIDLPVEDAVLRDEVERAVRATPSEDAYVRIVVTRGSGPLSLDPATATHPLRVVLVAPVAPPSRDAYARGIAAVTLRTRRAADDTSAAGAKVTNYLASLLAVREAKSRGAEEALILNAEGAIVEGATSNVFAVRGGRLVTPPENAGILVGITRTYVLAAAARLALDVDERSLLPEELYAADEVFITSSIREVVPVVCVDDRPVGHGAPGPRTRDLHRALRLAAGAASSPMPWE